MALGPGTLFGSVASSLAEALRRAESAVRVLWADDQVADHLVADPVNEGSHVMTSRLIPNKSSSQPWGMFAFEKPNQRRNVSRRQLNGSIFGQPKHLRHKTVEYMWNTMTSATATNTTLGTSTQYTSETKTFYIPETVDRVFESVTVLVTFRSSFGGGYNIGATRIGIQLGSAATQNYNQAYGTIGSGTRNVYYEVSYDVTDYFNANFGTGTSQTAVVSLTASSSVAANINGATFTLVCTYAFDPAAAATRLKTIRIPIQSQRTTLTTSHQEIGTDGTESPAPTNQIPQLTNPGGFLPESSVTIRQVFLSLYGNDAVASAGTVTPYIQINALTEVARAPIDATLQTNQTWRDNYDLTSIISYTAASLLNMRTDVTARLAQIGGILVVTYEYDHAATVTAGTALYEAVVPLTLPDSNGVHSNVVYDAFDGTVATQAGALRLSAVFDIEEPGTPTLVQSGVLTLNTVGSSAGTFQKRAGQQTFRVYTPVASSGPQPVIHRTDINTGWSLQRGRNALPLEIFGTGRTTQLGSIAIINYTAGIRSDVDSGNHVVNYAQRAFDPTMNIGISSPRNLASMRVPYFGSTYKISGAYIDMSLGVVATTPSVGFGIEHQEGEYDNTQTVVWSVAPHSTGSILKMIFPLSHSVNDGPNSLGKIDLTKAHRQVLVQNANSFCACWSWWICLHQHAFTVSGSVTVSGIAAVDGKTVEIFAKDPVTGVFSLVTTATISGGAGGFSATVPDNTRSYFASYTDGSVTGRSALSTPT